jgi:hypothetical protein
MAAPQAQAVDRGDEVLGAVPRGTSVLPHGRSNLAQRLQAVAGAVDSCRG